MLGSTSALIPALALLLGGDEPEAPAATPYATVYRAGEAEIRLRGRLMADLGVFDGDGLERATGVAIEDGTELRRARIGAEGSLLEGLRFRAELELAPDDPELRDLWVQLAGPLSPIGASIRIGHFREPMGLEAKTASPQLAFVERSAPTEAFTPGRNLGAMARGTLGKKRAHWAVGAFLEADSQLSRSGGDHSFTARTTWLPWRSADGRGLVHLGLAASHRDTEDGGASFDARPGAHMLDPLLDTGSLAADSVELLGLEAAWVRGPVSIQGELLRAAVDVAGAPDADLHGATLQASWFPTGDHRPYSPARGAFGLVRPERSWWRGDGPGAWELVARWSRTDLDDGAAAGDVQDDLGLGVNWYLDDHARVMLDLMRIELEDAGESAGLAVLRLQLTL